MRIKILFVTLCAALIVVPLVLLIPFIQMFGFEQGVVVFILGSDAMIFALLGPLIDALDWLDKYKWWWAVPCLIFIAWGVWVIAKGIFYGDRRDE